MTKVMGALSVLLFLGACASGSLEIRSDLYRETPTVERERKESRLIDVAVAISQTKVLAREIAAAMEIPMGTLKTWMFRARKELRIIVEKELGGENQSGAR